MGLQPDLPIDFRPFMGLCISGCWAHFVKITVKNPKNRPFASPQKIVSLPSFRGKLTGTFGEFLESCDLMAGQPNPPRNKAV